MNPNDFLEYWREKIERDLSAFIDPGTTLTLTVERRTVVAKWSQRGQLREDTFAIGLDSGVRVQSAERILSYASFFAAEDIADLRGLSKMILQTRKKRLFVPTKARRLGEIETPAAEALAVLREAMEDPWGDDATLVVMVTGEAGAGKTSVLQELVRTQADAYLRGQQHCLYLYVNAQGRALARFNEALATELQDLRAQLTYHGVSTLVRNGLLVPVIDGFDELLGVGGYEDAFSSLASFIEELDGTGRVVASARSTYYEQEFVARANRVSSLGAQVWKQTPVEVVAWGEAELRNYVALRIAEVNGGEGQIDDTLARVKNAFQGRNAELIEKPLFVVRATELVLRDIDISDREDLLEALVEGYLERERTEKLLSRQGDSLLSRPQLRSLLVDLAEEMWNQETRELDRRSVREIAEYALVIGGVDEGAHHVVIDRMPDLAFLMPGEAAGSVAFEHETFFAFFLAQKVLQRLIDEPSNLANTLGRSVLPPDVAYYAMRNVPLSNDTDLVQTILANLADNARVPSTRSQQVRENAGLLAATLLERACSEGEEVRGIVVANVVLPGGALRGVTLRDAEWRDVEFRRVDLTHTKFFHNRARNVFLLEPIVDRGTTRLELDGMDPYSQVIGIQEVSDRGTHGVFDPEEVTEIFTAIGLIRSSVQRIADVFLVAKEELSLLERFIRAYNRSNPVCTSDDYLQRVFHHPSWPRIEALLVECGVVTSEIRVTGGPTKVFLRRQVLAEEVLAGINKEAAVPASVKTFWSAFAAEFPKSARAT